MNRNDLIASLTAERTSRVIDDRRSISWPELFGEAERFSEVIQAELENDYRPVGISGGNGIDYLIALFGILLSGRSVVPLNTRLTEGELRNVLQQVNASGNITGKPLDTIRESWLHKRDGSSEISDSITGEPSVLICSSGSGGGVKAAVLSLESMIRHAEAVNEHLSITEQDHWLVCLPFFHVGGLTIPFRCGIAGATTTILDSADPKVINQQIDHHGITLISMVATSLTRLLDERGDIPFPKSLRAIVTGGGPVPDELKHRCPIVYPTYGMTETGSMVTCAKPGCDEKERFSAGSLLPRTQIIIRDESGNPCKSGQCGNIIAKGPGVFKGYVNDANKTALILNEGWVNTGDIGYLDEFGYLHVLARRTDLIISGGENIVPAEIEAVLKLHHLIQDAVVLPIADLKWGQVPGAVISCGKKKPAVETIKHFLSDRLASYKHPRRFVFVASLPLLPTGKRDLAVIRILLENQDLR